MAVAALYHRSMTTTQHTAADLIAFDIRVMKSSMEAMAKTLANYTSTLVAKFGDAAHPDIIAHWAAVIAAEASQLAAKANHTKGMEQARRRLEGDE